jgi:hypothetical protein
MRRSWRRHLGCSSRRRGNSCDWAALPFETLLDQLAWRWKSCTRQVGPGQVGPVQRPSGVQATADAARVTAQQYPLIQEPFGGATGGLAGGIAAEKTPGQGPHSRQMIQS